MEWSLAILSLGVGIFSGLLGVGGGVFLVPALLYLAPHWIQPFPFSPQEVTALGAVNGLAATGSSTFLHWQHGRVRWPLVCLLGLPALLGAYLGAFQSGRWSTHDLHVLLAILLTIVVGLTLWSFKLKQQQSNTPASLQTMPLSIKRQLLTSVTTLAVGYVAGVMGIGGGIFFLPILFIGLKLPINAAVGSVAGAVFLVSISSVLGKWQAGLLEPTSALLIASGSLVGGWLGAKLQPLFSEQALRLTYFGMILIALSKTLYELWVSG